jgi:hypothetical protein
LLNHTLQVIHIERIFGQVDHIVAIRTDDADVVDGRDPLLTGVAPECFQMVNDSAALRPRTVEVLELETAAVAVQAIFLLGFFSEFGVADRRSARPASTLLKALFCIVGRFRGWLDPRDIFGPERPYIR